MKIKSKTVRRLIIPCLSTIVLSDAPATASPDYAESQVELRMRKSTDLTIIDNGSEAADDEEQNDYHFRLLAGLLTGWEDDVSIGFTIQSQGLWKEHRDGDRLESGIAEAYIAAGNIGFLPVSAKLGRQRLNAGRGLLLSDHDDAWGFDAADLRYDAFPTTLTLQAGRTTRLSPDTELEWIGLSSIRHEPRTPFVRETEIYAGAVESYGGEFFMPFGMRVEAALSPELQIWTELAGQSGRSPEGAELEAWITDLGVEYIAARTVLRPLGMARLTLASGGEDQDRRDFVPMMDRDIGGVVLRPRLSNIRIFQLRASCRPAERISLHCDLFDYRRNAAEEGVVGTAGWIYNGVTAPASAASRDLGWEANLTFEIETADRLTFRFIAGYFDFGSAYKSVEESSVTEGWLEMVWNY